MVEKYLLKVGPKLRLVSNQQMENLTLAEAVIIGLACKEEQRKQLLLDAKEGDKFFYGRKVVEALEISLKKLGDKFPHFKDQIRSFTKKPTLN